MVDKPSLTGNALLHPVVITMIPRWSEAVGVVSELNADHVVALAETEQDANLMRLHWASREGRPLLLLRCSQEGSAEIATETIVEIAGRHPWSPVGVLLADGPEAPGFREDRRRQWNRAFAKAVTEAVLDVQICEYSRSWATHPPRLR